MCDGAGGNGILEHQVPADDPGEELAKRGVGIRVCAAGDRNGGSELGVAERGKRTADAREHEREHEPGAGELIGGQPGENEDAGADDGPMPRADRLTGPSTRRSWCSPAISASSTSISFTKKSCFHGDIDSPRVRLDGGVCQTRSRRTNS